MEQYPKLLIISHNLYDVTNNIGKTLVSLLQGWPKDRIAQVYFRNDIPSFEYCSHYFCITDKDVFKSVGTVGILKAGKKIELESENNVTDTEKSLYRVGNKRVPIVSCIRDVLWSFGTWKTKQLRKWIADYSPDLILFVPNDYTLAYKVCIYVQSITKTPIVPFYMDDSFYYDCDSSFVDHLRRLSLRRKAIDVHKNASIIFTICEKMSLKYSEVFNLECIHFMNSVQPSGFDPKDNDVDCINMSYIGNLHSNRWKSLIDIGLTADRLNEQKMGKKFQIKIYSASDLSEETIKRLSNIKSISMEGSLQPSEVKKYQRIADVLIHIEAFDKKSINSTRYSLSTKIPEYLNSGVCVLAYGPKDIASMEYLYKNQLAYVCNDKKEIEKILLDIIYNKARKVEIERKGLDFVRKYHDISIISNQFKHELLKQNMKEKTL